jgi:hypothetical protein
MSNASFAEPIFKFLAAKLASYISSKDLKFLVQFQFSSWH